MKHRITHETRDDSYQAILPLVGTIQMAVFEAVRASYEVGVTAEEASERAGCSLNSARSRLTELFNCSRVVVVDKRRNKAGNRMIAVYAVPRKP